MFKTKVHIETLSTVAPLKKKNIAINRHWSHNKAWICEQHMIISTSRPTLLTSRYLLKSETHTFSGILEVVLYESFRYKVNTILISILMNMTYMRGKVYGT